METKLSLPLIWIHLNKVWCLLIYERRNDDVCRKLPPVKNEKELQERLRILQNQNRFLNEEVKKLAKLRQTDRSTFYQQEE